MNPVSAILICERDTLFREALRNFLLAAGYARVEAVATVREALAKLRRESYRCILVGLSRPLLNKQRLARVAQQRQPGAKVLFLVSANDVLSIKDASTDYVMKERAFSILLELLTQSANHDFANPMKKGSQ
jgi:DNA-binding NtrC family response regulator